MNRLFFWIAAVFALAVPASAEIVTDVLPNETPPAIAPFPQVETHRIRITNAVDGPVQVSCDSGRTWQLVGRVTAPATDSLMGYLASGYSQPGAVAATAVHGIRIRVGDRSFAYAKLINILPLEFSRTNPGFGGHVSGTSGIYTNIPAGTSIFRDLSPYVGNPVLLDLGPAGTTPIPINYRPQVNDVFIIVVKRPVNDLRQVVFENTTGGNVTVTYADGTNRVITHVLKPVLGVGRFDATSYTGVGAINTNHSGTLTISTAPISDDPEPEGTGPERRGGFQIQPSYHNSEVDEAGAPQILVIGTRRVKRIPELEGMPPFFYGYFNLAWNPADLTHSWHTDIKLTSAPGEWQPLAQVIGDKPDALKNVIAIRLLRQDPGDDSWIKARTAAAVSDYAALALARAREGYTTVVRGVKQIEATANDPRMAVMSFFLDGTLVAISNSQPFVYDWQTTRVPDGEYAVEMHAQDKNGNVLSTSRQLVWVDNAGAVHPH
jgi:hypothetical protein